MEIQVSIWAVCGLSNAGLAGLVAAAQGGAAEVNNAETVVAPVVDEPTTGSDKAA